jgi:hypothetical protein
MARKTKLVTIQHDNRDKGKTFLVTEMHPIKGEKWATRALIAIARSGSAEMPPGFKEELEGAGMAGIAALGARALTTVAFDEAEPLLDEMMQCVAYVPDTSKVDQMTQLPIVRPMVDGDIEEITTILFLRSEVIELHVGFSPAAFLSTIGAAARASMSIGNATLTSPPLSEPSLALD